MLLYLCAQQLNQIDMDTRSKAMKTVEQLNGEVIGKGVMDYYCPWEFESIGWQGSSVKFMGVRIWNDCDDPRKVDDKGRYEPMKTFLKRESIKILADLNLKLK